MRTAGLSLMLSGWVIVVCAVILLASPTPMAAFLACGLGVEILGLFLSLRGASTHEEGRPE